MGTQKGKMRLPHLSARISKDLYDELNKRAKEQGRSMTILVEEALKLYFESVQADEDLRFAMISMRDRLTKLERTVSNLVLEED